MVAYRRMPIAREFSTGSRVQAKMERSPKLISEGLSSNWRPGGSSSRTPTRRQSGPLCCIRDNPCHSCVGP